MRKYYDLIVSMIKSHRKFIGCEDILENIIDDVYNHAEVVLNTVENESVVVVAVPVKRALGTRYLETVGTRVFARGDYEDARRAVFETEDGRHVVLDLYVVPTPVTALR